MIHELTIEGFRGFDYFRVREIGRVNLLVGTNNCGKTSILEAIQILKSNGDPSSLWHVASRRGERLIADSETRTMASAEADICHLFCGHEISIGSTLKIVAHTDGGCDTLTVTAERSAEPSLFAERPDTEEELDQAIQERQLALRIEWSEDPAQAARLPLSMRGGVPIDGLRRYQRASPNGSLPVKFISTAGLTVSDIVSMFEDIVLTPEEDLLIRALGIIEPTIERLASVSSDWRRGYPGGRAVMGERGGIVVKCRNSPLRIPIGSMGDGMWRMLGLSLALVSAKNGILLVDEIDTGLHFSVLEKMWTLIDQASGRLNVQVFATTHSRDAYESLAAISRESVSQGSQVTIQRIDRSRSESVAFTEQEIVASAMHGTEVR